jgi:hypothetical protein
MADDSLVEIVNLSDHKGTYKAVQLLVDEKPFLVLGPSPRSFHYRLLESFLQERGISFITIQPPGTKIPCNVPALEGEHYKVVGMGDIYLYPQEKLYTGMSGESQDYRVGIDPTHRSQVKRTLLAQGWTCM